jgi:hypothetical protein
MKIAEKLPNQFSVDAGVSASQQTFYEVLSSKLRSSIERTCSTTNAAGTMLTEHFGGYYAGGQPDGTGRFTGR